MTLFTRNLRWAIVVRGWVPQDLAERMPLTWGVSLSSRVSRVRRYTRGDQDPKLGDVEAFALALDVPPAVLAFGRLWESTDEVR